MNGKAIEKEWEKNSKGIGKEYNRIRNEKVLKLERNWKEIGK